MSENIVEVRNLTKSFGDLLVLDDISFDVKRGEFLCIVGPTGCGKTTFLNSLTKLYDINSGSILVNGEEMDFNRHKIAYIFQEYSTMEWLTVAENVAYGLKIKHTPKEEIDRKVDEMLKLVKMEEYRDYYPRQLSVSMLQRVVIARAFATTPDLLLMDEPYGHLDLQLKYRLEDELIKLWENSGTTVIFITHNIEEAVYLSSRLMVLTNKPTKIKEIVDNDLPRPRDITSPDFVALRNRITDLIKWW